MPVIFRACGSHLCDIATAGHMNKKIYNIQMSVCARVCIQTHTLQFTYTHTTQCKSMKTSCFDPTANWGYIHECGNTLYTFLQAYLDIFTILQMFVKLQSKDTPSGNKENVTFFIAISCIGKDAIH